MKNILTITLLFITSIIFSQTDRVVDKSSEAIERIYSDGSKIVEKTYETANKLAPKLEKALGTLSSELKVGANHVWDLLVKQQLVWSICYLILTLSALFNWGSFIYRFRNANLVDQEQISYINKGYSSETKTTTRVKVPKQPNYIVIIHLIICIILSILSFYNFSDMLTGFINPEFGALKTITEIAGQIK